VTGSAALAREGSGPGISVCGRVISETATISAQTTSRLVNAIAPALKSKSA